VEHKLFAAAMGKSSAAESMWGEWQNSERELAIQACGSLTLDLVVANVVNDNGKARLGL
jgi:hypothetical protein